MEFTQGKYFIDENNEKIYFFQKPNDKEYYTFIKEKNKEGFRQIIISSDILIEILKYNFLENKASIVNIELLEEDPEYLEVIERYIRNINQNRDYFVNLIEELKYLSDEKTAEIRLVKFKYRCDEEAVMMSITINGLISYNNNDTAEKGIEDIKKLIAERLIDEF